MSNIAIKVENLSKAYQLGQIGTGTISRDLERWYARIRGKEDPFLRIGESNNQNTKSKSDVVWSLKDINFEIEQGDAVGIIGRNGAGKSTLLKILSKVTAPTTGKISGKGRIASLLEVGTGFHPELSGRENIFLNGAILGMRKKEIQRKLNEIVDFAGIERYLDTPVKRYSSGMYVRLAFAVAAHLESEILVVDEVLAVGDAEFQKKCLGKMGEVSKGEGRTVLFVSHNMAAIKVFCKKGIFLNNGQTKGIGNINDIINLYENVAKGEAFSTHWKVGHFSNEIIHVNDIKITNNDINYPNFNTDSDLLVTINLRVNKNDINVLIDLELFNSESILVFDIVSPPKNYSEGVFNIDCLIPKHLLNTGSYFLNCSVVRNHNIQLFNLVEALSFEIIEGKREIEYYGEWPGVIRPRFKWQINNIT